MADQNESLEDKIAEKVAEKIVEKMDAPTTGSEGGNDAGDSGGRGGNQGGQGGNQGGRGVNQRVTGAQEANANLAEDEDESEEDEEDEEDDNEDSEEDGDSASATQGAQPDPTRYHLVKEFTPKRGFETVLYNQLKEGGVQTAEEAKDAILKSGEYQRVAPRAAELRPQRPVNTCIRVWLAAEFLEVVKDEPSDAAPAGEQQAEPQTSAA